MAICGGWLLFACGAQGPPRPPGVVQPERIEDLTASQRGRTLVLSFTLPRLATNGERLTKPLEVQVFRAATSPGEHPRDDPETLTAWIMLNADEVVRYTQSQKLVFPAPLSEQEVGQLRGATFSLAARALTRGFRRRPVEGELSDIVHVTLLAVSGPVENLQVRATEKELELGWSPAVTTETSAPVTPSGYRVYRSRTGNPDSFQVLGEVTSETFRDPEFEFERAVFYKVRAIFKHDGQVAESEDSSVVPITPRDTFPPAAPTRLSCVYAAGAVELIWTANSEPDLAGYIVYRREEGGSPRRLNKELLRTPIFRDLTVEPERQYFYRATAVDLVNNEGPPSEEVQLVSR